MLECDQLAELNGTIASTAMLLKRANASFAMRAEEEDLFAFASPRRQRSLCTHALIALYLL